MSAKFREPLPLDRVSMLPLITAIKRQLKQALEPVVFEPNDALTRGTIASIVEGYMSDIKFRRGVVEYEVICDERNNSATVINNGELHIDVIVKPPHAVEYITIHAKAVSNAQPDFTEDLGHQLEAWTVSRGSDLHRPWVAVGQPVPLGPGWQPSNGDREVPPVARHAP